MLEVWIHGLGSCYRVGIARVHMYTSIWAGHPPQFRVRYNGQRNPRFSVRSMNVLQDFNITRFKPNSAT